MLGRNYIITSSEWHAGSNVVIWYCRLYDVVHTNKKLYLVFEYLNQDLKKYMDSTPASGISMPLVKVHVW